jgi:spermidine/putrescine transport system permease protein
MASAPHQLRTIAVLGIPLTWVLITLVVPVGVLLAHSFFVVEFPTFKPALVFDSYNEIVTDPQYFQVIGRTLKIALITATCSLLVAYPLAYFLAIKVKSHTLRTTLYFLIILPLWVSYLLRAYVWKTILGQEGILNSFLMYTGLISEPSPLFLYNQFSMVITLTYIFIPFMAMPIFAALEKIPPRLLEASADLGMTPLQTFRHVTLPLSMPGVVAGLTFTICLTSGDFVAAFMVGGPSSTMVASTIQSQFGASLNWPLGAALSVIMFLFVLTLISISDRFETRAQGTTS